MRKLVLLVAASMIAPAALTFSVPGEAKPRPTSDASDANAAYGFCLAGGGDTNAGNGTGGKCEGAICYCCYDDGCFICNDVGLDCVWDQKARTRNLRLRLKNGIGTVKPTVHPGLTVRPPRGGPLAPGLLEGGKGLSTQGPAATGQPIAPPPPPAGQLR
jgi:hypothetical protein